VDNVFIKGPDSENGLFLIGGANPIHSIIAVGFLGAGASLNIGYSAYNPSGDDIIVRDNNIWGDMGVHSDFTNFDKWNNMWRQEGWARPRTEAFNGDTGGVDVPVPSSPIVKVVKNLYNDKLAYISVLNYPLGDATTVSVDLSSVLSSGDGYLILNAADMYGSPLIDSTYSGGNVSIPVPSGRMSSFVVSKKESTPPPPPVNTPPVVNAGPDQTVVLSNLATLNGMVTDDGNYTVTWSKTSGPGTVTFGNKASLNTTASFSKQGGYTLRLTANDGEFIIFDELQIMVKRK